MARHLEVGRVSPFKKATLNEGVKKKEKVSDKKDVEGLDIVVVDDQ